jgi:hypothetical protein
MAYHATHTVATLDGLCHLTLKVRRCENPNCTVYHQPYRPEEETSVALPHGEFGLDVIALIGALLSTGRSVDVPFVQVVELQQGKITQARLYFDSMTLLQQLGVVSLHLASSHPAEPLSPSGTSSPHVPAAHE